VTSRAYTDGACLGNPGPGGWAFVVDGGPWASGSEARTTNQRMEITAALRATESITGPMVVVSDSTYVVNCFRQRWWESWLERGWLNSRKQPVANRDLWEPLVELVRERGDVEFTWVKGHSGDRLNTAADRLAMAAARSQQGRSGENFGDEVVAGLDDDVGGSGPAGSGPAGSGSGGSGSAGSGPGDDPSGSPGTARDPVGGRGLVVAGHRPPELGGYQDNPVAEDVRRRLVDILEAKRQMHEELVVLTGLGLGAEQLGAEAAAEAGVPYVAVLPFPDPDSVWPAAGRDRFARLRAGARDEVLVSKKAPRSKAEAGKAMGRRDEWLARHGSEAVLVWDRTDGTLARLFERLERAFGPDVWVLEPREQ